MKIKLKETFQKYKAENGSEKFNNPTSDEKEGIKDINKATDEKKLIVLETDKSKISVLQTQMNIKVT